MDHVDSELIEILAAVEHERWSSWMVYMLNNFGPTNITRWIKQMSLPYSELSEYSKESDRAEVRKTLAAIKKYYSVPGAFVHPDDADVIQKALNSKHERLEKYDQLIYAVAKKCPGESRFETALRYINEKEGNLDDGSCDRQAMGSVERRGRPEQGPQD
jgi:hypothetical protein